MPTPEHLQIPEDRLGDPEAVQGGLDTHAEELAGISAQRKVDGMVVGVINTWDMAKSLSQGSDCVALMVSQVMSAPAVAVEPGDSVAAVLARLEEKQISAIPVVENGEVLGLINTDILASRVK